jgi:hypothetical protein
MDNVIELKIFERLLSESIGDEIHVFDFDDTLVKTNSKIYLTSRDELGNEIKKSLTPREYAQYKRRDGDVFDYSDFEQVIEPQPVQSTMLKLRMAIQDFGEKNVFILTARGNPGPVREFLDSQGVPNIRIFAVGTSDPQAKAKVIEDEVLSRGIKRVKFYDDASKNIAAVKALRDDLPGVEIIAVKVG